MKKLTKTTVSIYQIGTPVWIVCPRMKPARKFVPTEPSGKLMIRRGKISQAMTHTFWWNDGTNICTDVQYKIEYVNPSTKRFAYTDTTECEVFETRTEARAYLKR
jgi:hypothetical protein